MEQQNSAWNRKGINMRKFALLCLALAAVATMSATARADDGLDPLPTPMPQVVDIIMIVTPTPPPPVDTREIHYIEHSISQKAIDEMAAIFWADCNTDLEKQCFAAVAVNRMVHGDPFDSTLEEVLSAKGEFNHGHISDRNREKAKRFLNFALTQYVDGEYAGLQVPSSAVYVSRDDSSNKLVFYNINWQEVYRLK